MMEEQYELPEGWMWTTLRDVADVITGNTPPKKDQENYGDYIPFVKPPELNDCIITKSVDNLSEKGAKIARILSPESILVSCIGILGKTGINKVPIAFNQQINAAIFSENILPKYGFYYFQTPEAKELLNKKSSSTTIPIVNKSRFKTLQFPLPPLNEQHRIVVKLEALLAQVNASKDHLANVPPLMKQFRQSVLAAACSGDLTKEWRKEHPDAEPVSDLLKRIQKERIQKYEEECRKAKEEEKKKPKKTMNLELQEVDTAGLPELPEGWVRTKLKDLIEPSKEKAQPPFNKGEKYIGLEHMGSFTNRIIGIGKGADVKSTKNRFYKGDLLYGKLRPYLNKTTVVDFDGICSTDILVFRRTNYLENKYLMRFLSTQQVVSFANQNMEGIQLPRISFGRLSQISIPLPPLIEQHIIAQCVETLFHSADEVEQQYQKALYHVDHLTQSVLAKAFRGELVPQDPNDEPASVLLERIIQEGAKKEKEKKPRKKKSKTLLDYC